MRKPKEKYKIIKTQIVKLKKKKKIHFPLVRYPMWLYFNHKSVRKDAVSYIDQNCTQIALIM